MSGVITQSATAASTASISKSAPDLTEQLTQIKKYTFSKARRVDILNGRIDKKTRNNLELSNCRSFTKEDAERFPNACARIRPDEHLLLDYSNPNTRGFIVPLDEVLRNRIPLT